MKRKAENIGNEKIPNPYPGLKPFTYIESQNYYGREQVSAEIIFRLQRNKVVYLTGPSGSGKSSLVFASLIPKLEGGAMRGAKPLWRLVIFRPSNNSILNLAAAIYDAYHGDLTQDIYNQWNTRIESEISREAYIELALSGSIDFFDWTQKFQNEASDGNENLLIIIDQFEELFTNDHTVSNKDSFENVEAFVKIIKAIRTLGRGAAYVLSTMRTDALIDCEDHSALITDISDNQFVVRKLSYDEYLDIIISPAETYGVYFTDSHSNADLDKIESEWPDHPKVIQRLMSDLKSEEEDYNRARHTRLPDQLPLLQHALAMLWKAKELDKDANDISEEDYLKLKDYIKKYKSNLIHELPITMRRLVDIETTEEKTDLSLMLDHKLDIIVLNLLKSSHDPKKTYFFTRNLFLLLIDMNLHSKKGLRRSVTIKEIINFFDVTAQADAEIFDTIIEEFTQNRTKIPNFDYSKKDEVTSKKSKLYKALETLKSNNTYVNLGRNRYLKVSHEGREVNEVTGAMSLALGNKNAKENDYRIDVCHETLLRHWERLKFWYHQEQKAISEANVLHDLLGQKRRKLAKLSVDQTNRFVKWRHERKAFNLYNPNWMERHKPYIVKDRMFANETDETAESMFRRFNKAISKNIRRKWWGRAGIATGILAFLTIPVSVVYVNVLSFLSEKDIELANAKTSQYAYESTVTDNRARLTQSITENEEQIELYSGSENLVEDTSRLAKSEFDNQLSKSNQPIEKHTTKRCEGYIWLGSDNYPKVKTVEEYPIPISQITRGDKFITQTNLKLRDDIEITDPSAGQNYIQGEWFATISKDVSLEALNEPLPYWNSDKTINYYWVKVAAPIESCFGVYIQYSTDKEFYLAQQIRHKLVTEYDFNVWPPEKVPAWNGETKTKYHVGYPVMEKVSNDLNKAVNSIFKDFEGQDDLSSQQKLYFAKVVPNEEIPENFDYSNNLEIWIGRLPEQTQDHWTPWYNRDTPLGIGDIEVVHTEGEYCTVPRNLQCRHVKGQFLADETICKKDPDKNEWKSECLTTTDTQCDDYEIRMLCAPLDEP